MKAAVLYKGEKELRIEDVPVRTPGPGEVRVKVKYCGVCGSDVHAVLHDVIRMPGYPRIMGHESSGNILELGEGVSDFKVGDAVVIGAGTSCGECEACKAGRYNACNELGVLGFNLDGAFAEEITIPARYLTPLPESVPFDQGAIMADAVSTPFHAVKYAGRLKEGETLAVYGCGGLGIHGVLLGKALGAKRVIAVDIDEGALRNAGEFGADEIINAAKVKNVGKAVKEAGGGGVDVIVDFSGYMKNIEQSLRAMNTQGRIVMVGLGRGGLNFIMPQVMIYKMLSVCGSYGCEHGAVGELIELHQGGKLDLSRSITSHHPLEEVNQCMHDLDNRKGNPIRFIIEPGA